MKKLLFLLLFLAASSALWAQMVTVSGYVTSNGTPVVGQLVHLVYERDSVPGGWGPIDTVYTDSTGFYSSSKLVNSSQGVVSVTTYCNGMAISDAGYYYPGNLNLTVNLDCSTVSLCYAYFMYKNYSQSPNITVFTAMPVPSPSATYMWDFGDGNSASGVTTTHMYAASGLYQVCLTVVDSPANCWNTYCESIYVFADSTNCDASFMYMDNGFGHVTFTANNASPASNAVYYWDFGDGNTSIGNPVSHQYATSGCYLVCLTAVDSSRNCIATACQGLFVQDSSSVSLCDATFDIFMNVDSQGNNYTVFFSPQVFLPVFMPGVSYHWDFGDGSTGSNIFEMHTYAGPGTYTVCLILTDSLNKCSDTVCQVIVLDGVKLQVITLGIKDAEKNISINNLYPNPVEDVISLELHSLKNDNCTLTIRDIMGREIYRETRMMNAGNSEWKTDVSELRSGIYFIEAKSSSQIAGSKFIKK